MYEYGYFVGGQRVVLGTVTDDDIDAKQKEINYANKIDPNSRWFIDREYLLYNEISRTYYMETNGVGGFTEWKSSAYRFGTTDLAEAVWKEKGFGSNWIIIGD